MGQHCQQLVYAGSHLLSLPFRMTMTKFFPPAWNVAACWSHPVSGLLGFPQVLVAGGPEVPLSMVSGLPFLYKGC